MIIDYTTGEVIEVELFVAVLGGCDCFSAEMTRSRKLVGCRR